MRRLKGYEILIIITYIAMAAVCVYLNFFSTGQGGDLTNLIVNVAMFIIVGVIFIVSMFGSLWPTARIAADLRKVTERIDDDAKHSHKFLWEKYRDEKEELFKDKVLVRQYQDYMYELERIVHTDETFYKCDIEDYIGYDLIDSVIHREKMNLVAGVMTGLGILGTFIGLSLGLQSFNTGTTAEITNSIEPLMDGIKVAFHTSIYGMVFSLVFNFVYKCRLDDAEQAVRNFLTSYKKYVMPDTATDGVNRLMELQQQQTEAIISLSDTMAHQLSKGLKEMLEPQFDRFDQTIADFATVATRNQMDQLNRIVNAFISEMNRSLGESLTEFSTTINTTMAVQKSNENQMREIFQKNVSTADNMNKITEQTGMMAEALKNYSEDVRKLEDTTVETLELMRKQSEMSQDILTGAGRYMSELEIYRKSLDISSKAFDGRLQSQEERIKELQKLTEAVPLEVNETFNIINDNLQIVENHFKDTIENINKTMDQVPDMVDYTYRSMEQSLERMAKTLKEMKALMESMENYYRTRR